MLRVFTCRGFIVLPGLGLRVFKNKCLRLEGFSVLEFGVQCFWLKGVFRFIISSG